MLEPLKDFLQGKWLGHPLHPALVHLPTGPWPAALAFDLVSRFAADNGGNAVFRTSLACIVGGLVAVLAAVPTGLADWSEIKPGKPAWKIGLAHLLLNVTVAGLFLWNAILRFRAGWDTAEQVTATQMTLTVIAVVLLLVSGYLGGFMVFDKGVGVARQSKGKWRAIAVQGGARVPEE